MSLQRSKKLNEEADAMIQATVQTVPTEPEVVPEVPAPDVVTTEEKPPEPGEIPSTQPVDPQPDTVDEVAKLREQLSTSEQRYRTLQGMLEKSSERIKELQQMVLQLSQPVPAQATATATTPAATKYVTEKDEEAFGADLIDLARRIATEIVDTKVGTIDSKFAEVDKKVQQVGETAKKTAEDKFFDALDIKVSDWQEINDDPLFIEHLGKYGLQALQAAVAAMDLAETAKFFNDYKKISGKVAEVVTPPAPSKSLESLQAPGKGKSTPAALATKGKVWTKADINKLYEDQRKRLITEVEFNALEADLFKAQSEGRVVD